MTSLKILKHTSDGRKGRVQYTSKGKVYRYRVYKTYRSGRNVLVYRTDSHKRAIEKARKLIETSMTAAVVILDQFGYNVVY